MNEIVKNRRIKVEGMTCEGCEKRINEALSKRAGVREVRADKGGTVFVEYDLKAVSLKSIEEQILTLGYRLPDGVFAKVKRSLIHDAEQNELERTKTPAAPCCSNPEELLSKE